MNPVLMVETDEQRMSTDPEDCLEKIQPMRNSVSSSCVAASCCTTLACRSLYMPHQTENEAYCARAKLCRNILGKRTV